MKTEWGDILTDIHTDDEEQIITSKRDISQYLNMELVEQSRFKPDKSLLALYPCIEDFIVKNLQLNTQLKEEMIRSRSNTRDARELEDYRGFPMGFFQQLGVFYSTDVNDLINRYDYMRHTDLFQITNSSYIDRYMLPIDLPDGRVITHMGYAPPTDTYAIENKYMMANIDWIDQGNIIGNLGSIARHKDSKYLFVCEGMMDAYRLESVYKSPSIALLGSVLTDCKKAILQMLKSEGYILVYVPDTDEAGQDNRLIKSKLFDSIMLLPESEEFNDYDGFVHVYYIKYILNHHEELNVRTEPEKTPVSSIPLKVIQELNEELKTMIKFTVPLDSLVTSVENDFSAIIKGFSMSLDSIF